jgi:hypothetical protein
LSEEIPKMIAKDIATANMFESSVYAGDARNVLAPNTLYLEGKIYSFEYADGNLASSGSYNDARVKLSVHLLNFQNNILWASPAREAFRFPKHLALHWNQSQQLGFPYLVEAFAECVNDLKQDIYSGSSTWASSILFSKAAIASTAEQSIQTRPPVFPLAQKWAVVIGIAQYRDSRIAGLRSAAADAQAFYDWLVSQQGGGYAPSRVRLLLDSEATAQNIKNALFTWLKQALEEDMAVIYFAGHGSPESPDSSTIFFCFPMT